MIRTNVGVSRSDRRSGEDFKPDRAYASLRRGTDDQRVALTTAAAKRRRADTAAELLELTSQREHETRTGHPDRVTERDRTAVRVDRFGVDVERASGDDAHAGERF